LSRAHPASRRDLPVTSLGNFRQKTKAKINNEVFRFVTFVPRVIPSIGVWNTGCMERKISASTLVQSGTNPLKGRTKQVAARFREQQTLEMGERCGSFLKHILPIHFENDGQCTINKSESDAIR
jgi:hypothetical protein